MFKRMNIKKERQEVRKMFTISSYKNEIKFLSPRTYVRVAKLSFIILMDWLCKGSEINRILNLTECFLKFLKENNELASMCFIEVNFFSSVLWHI